MLGILVPLATACTDPGQPAGPDAADARVTRPSQPPPAPPPPPPPTPAPAACTGVCLANADGTILGALTVGSGPAWSPDGRWIAFGRGGAIRVISVDGTGEIQLGDGTQPSWSPDGSRIAFASAEGISVMNADGSGVRTLVRHDFRDDTYKPWDMGVGKPSWSPDGALIAFEHLGDGDMQPAQVFVMNADGSNVRRLTRSLDRRVYAESDPSWSPDGSSITHWSYGYGIATTARAGGVPNLIFADFPSVAYGSRPAWSPDGKILAFNRANILSSSGRSIWVLGGVGGARVLIQDGLDAAWSPDGARIAFVGGRGG